MHETGANKFLSRAPQAGWAAWAVSSSRHCGVATCRSAPGPPGGRTGRRLANDRGRLEGRGYIQVNDRLETSAPDVWAIGECAGSPQFTHVSEDDFAVIRDNLAGGNRTTRDRLIPYCLFTDPPLARVGLGEAEPRRRGVAWRVARLPMGAVLRTRTTGETRGLMKALVDVRTDRILGFTMFGSEAGEVQGRSSPRFLGRGVSVSERHHLPESLPPVAWTHPAMGRGGLTPAA